jgi:hypothetical protein
MRKVSYSTGRRTLAVLVLLSAVPTLGANPKDLLGWIPADAEMAAVIVHMEKFSQGVDAAFKKISPSSEPPGVMDGIQRDMRIGEWVDFTKPFAMFGQAGGRGESVMLVHASGFAEKIATLPGASKTETGWKVGDETAGERMMYFAELPDGYVAMADSPERLASVRREGPSLADEAKTGLKLLGDRHVLIHLNMKALRPKVMQGIAQMKMQLPMIAMMAAQGGDPTAMTAMFQGFAGGAEDFIQQLAAMDLTIGVDPAAFDVTVATTFEEGKVRSFLGRTRPAQAPFFAAMEDRPSAVMLGLHVPGGMGEFYDYMIDKMMPPAGADEATQQGLESIKALNRLADGATAQVGFSEGKMWMTGAYITGDPAEYLRLLKEMLSTISTNPVMKQFSGGVQYESTGQGTINGVAVEKFRMVIDPTNPAAAQARAIYGENVEFAAGAMGKSVRFAVGDGEFMESAFASKPDKPLDRAERIVTTVKALPKDNNMVVLIDLMMLMPMFQNMMPGMLPDTSGATPGVPVGISLSLNGEPARLDLHVPFESVSRLTALFAPQPPM